MANIIKICHCGKSFNVTPSRARRNKSNTYFCSDHCKFNKPQISIEEFMSKVYPEPNTGCWLYIAPIFNKAGYGKVCLRKTDTSKNKQVLAHRFSYEILVGVIPYNTCICHLCDQPACVNPDHLFLGTISENILDMVRKNRQAKGSKIGNSKLTKDQVLYIRECGLPTKNLSEMFGVTYVTIRDVRRRRLWKHI